MKQIILENDNDVEKWLCEQNIKKIFLVSGSQRQYLYEILSHFENCIEVIPFSDYAPNPDYVSVINGASIFKKEGCDGMVAIGGGSALDVAKCIRLYADKPVPFLAIPTTAGTGSEATRYAVIYRNGSKLSVTDESMIPDAVMWDSRLLKTLPSYQRKATMMDALCHAIESFWSINSTKESRALSTQAIHEILSNMEGYLQGRDEGDSGMLHAAYIAGKAINITETTAGHAMCYKITSLYDTAHGHAAALCNRVLFPWMLTHIDRCTDPRGKEFLTSVLAEIGHAMGCSSAEEGARKFGKIFSEFALEVPRASEEEFIELRDSVNQQRLRNFPLELDNDTIDGLYHRILEERK